MAADTTTADTVAGEATREFAIDDILSVLTDVLVSKRHVDGLYDLLGFMAGEPVWTHQLPRVSREAQPSLREQFPDLAAIEIPDWSDIPKDQIKDTVFAWVDQQIAEHGPTRAVRPLAPEDHTSIDPITEFRMKNPNAQIIVIDSEET